MSVQRLRKKSPKKFETLSSRLDPEAQSTARDPYFHSLFCAVRRACLAKRVASPYSSRDGTSISSVTTYQVSLGAWDEDIHLHAFQPVDDAALDAEELLKLLTPQGSKKGPDSKNTRRDRRRGRTTKVKLTSSTRR